MNGRLAEAAVHFFIPISDIARFISSAERLANSDPKNWTPDGGFVADAFASENFWIL